MTTNILNNFPIKINVPTTFLEDVLKSLYLQPKSSLYTTIYLDEEHVDPEDPEFVGFVETIADEDFLKGIENCYQQNMSADETAEEMFDFIKA